jgi:hypothetical protein
VLLSVLVRLLVMKLSEASWAAVVTVMVVLQLREDTLNLCSSNNNRYLLLNMQLKTIWVLSSNSRLNRTLALLTLSIS